MHEYLRENVTFILNVYDIICEYKCVCVYILSTNIM